MDTNERIQQKTVVAQAMEHIRELIVSGYYKPGDKIPTEQELATRFGIGRSSIREAIKTFQYLGILDLRVPKGTFLNERSRISSEVIAWSVLLGDDDMWDILELRQVIEEEAFLSLMTKYVQDKDSFGSMFEKFEAEINNMRIGVKEKSIQKISLADYNFHAIIIAGGRNQLFFALFKALQVFILHESQKTYHAMKNINDILQDHLEIVDAIRAGILEKAITRHSAHFLRIRGLLAPGAVPKV